MSLRAAFRRTLGELDLAVDLDAPAGEVTVVVGPNGAGKTTLLRVLAGTLAAEEGTVALDGRVLDAPPTTFVPPERRHLGVVHQDHLLFAHLTSLDNVAFGPRCHGVSVGEARAAAHGWLERLGVAQQAALRPAALSGGQAQRVALARALAAEPGALLLDEPLAALDATTRSEVRRDLRAHLAGFAGPTVLVTHDLVDALTLADRIVVIEDGRVTQSGTLSEVTAAPRSTYLTDLLGVNLVHGTSDGVVVRTTIGLALPLAERRAGSGGARPAGEPGEPAVSVGPVVATFPPSAVHLALPTGAAVTGAPGGGSGSGEGLGVEARVDRLEALGRQVRIHLVGGQPAGWRGLVAELPATTVATLGLAEGMAVHASIDATEVTFGPG